MFKKHMTPLSVGGKKGSLHRHSGKGSTQEQLPSRDAMSSLTGGDPADRSMNDYVKATPSIQDASSAVGTPPQLGSVSPGDPSSPDMM